MSNLRTYFVAVACCSLLVAVSGCTKTETATTRGSPSNSLAGDQSQVSVTKPISTPDAEKNAVRIATYNTSMNRKKQGDLLEELKSGDSLQISRVAGTIRRVRPDILLLNEFDYEPTGESIQLFQDNFLASDSLADGVKNTAGDAKGAGQGSEPIRYPHVYTAPVNTGVPTGIDLNHNEKTNDPNDAYGFGNFPGQYGMVVLSQFPIDEDAIRTFQKFLWKDMPDAQVPMDPKTGEPYYDDAVMDIYRLSSKSHWDVPIRVGEQTLHFLVCHPTPPVFDGPEDRNGKRNHDEIRLWADYIDPKKSDYLVDGKGVSGGLPAGAMFVIAGDLNADPNDGDSSDHAIRQLLEHPLVDSSQPPTSEGAVEQTARQGGKNAEHETDPATDTGDFRDDTTGNMRIDYVLPSKTLNVTAAHVFWPTMNKPEYPLVRASDHRMAWIEVELE